MWYNPGRQVAYCERCVDSGETLGGLGQARCFVTGEELDYLGSANTAQPFWDRLGSFFRYPLQSDSLLIIGVFVVLAWLLTRITSATSLPILVIAGLLLLACITRYGFMIIEFSAEGRFTPPTLQETFSESGIGVLFQQVVVQLIFAGFTLLVAMLGSDFLDIIANALVMFVLPASLMLLATEKSIAAAVAPASILHLIRSIGWSYLLLYGFLFLLLGAAAALFDIFAQEIPAQYFLPVFLGITLYFMLVAYHLMGYVIFQYQAEIGFVAEDQQARERRRQARDPIDAKVEVLVKEGQYHKAAEALTRYLLAQPNSIRHHDKLSRLLLAMDDRPQALAHGQQYMTRLHELGDDARLYFVYGHYEQLDPRFMPEEPAVRVNLASALFERGKYSACCRLLANLHKQAPHFPQLAAAYLLMARALMDGFQQGDKAAQYLKFILAKFPEAPEREAAEQLLARLTP